ncbi:MAG: hypothetical protein NDI94_05035, partial [Candidatus Woesearchaeota archaeon]|nr:hypothetical protein [Candidatus Woesearchaeota archaeon]
MVQPFEDFLRLWYCSLQGMPLYNKNRITDAGQAALSLGLEINDALTIVGIKGDGSIDPLTKFFYSSLRTESVKLNENFGNHVQEIFHNFERYVNQTLKPVRGFTDYEDFRYFMFAQGIFPSFHRFSFETFKELKELASQDVPIVGADEKINPMIYKPICSMVNQMMSQLNYEIPRELINIQAGEIPSVYVDIQEQLFKRYYKPSLSKPVIQRYIAVAFSVLNQELNSNKILNHALIPFQFESPE